MIPVRKKREPSSFKAKVTKPGKVWLAANPTAKRPKNLWVPFLATIEENFSGLCGYAAMLDPTGGTVDHYRSFKNYPSLAYEWSNYRFAAHSMNASKRNADDTVLDPFDVKPGWFAIILPSLQLTVTKLVPLASKDKAEYTLRRLKLRDGEKIIRWRRRWYEMYQAGALSIDGLRTVAPLIADAVERQAPSASQRKIAVPSTPNRSTKSAAKRATKTTAKRK